MQNLSKNNVLVLVGPTASGKTTLSIEVAKVLGAEIISADSRQVYKGIRIASAVPSIKERQGIKHYFLEFLKPFEDYNAGEFGKQARALIDNLFKENILPVIAGGSGLYIKSCIDGFFEEETRDDDIRLKLYDELENYGKEHLHDKLKVIDPESASVISTAYYRRVIRALEVYYITGKKMSELQKEKPEINFNAIQVGLSLDRKYLYQRINKRVDNMFDSGLIEEVTALKSKGYHYKTHNALNTVGVKEVFRYLENDISYETMVDSIKQNSRRYAKRQMTWFNKDKRIKWIEVTENKSTEKLCNEVIKIFK